MLRQKRIMALIKMTSLLIAVGAVVVATITSAIAVRVLAYRIDKALENAGAYELSQEELREILEEIGENLGDNDSLTMVIAGDTAYWIEENSLMHAPVDSDDEVDFGSAMPYNAIEAPKEELKKILSILDTIKENQ